MNRVEEHTWAAIMRKLPGPGTFYDRRYVYVLRLRLKTLPKMPMENESHKKLLELRTVHFEALKAIGNTMKIGRTRIQNKSFIDRASLASVLSKWMGKSVVFVADSGEQSRLLEGPFKYASTICC